VTKRRCPFRRHEVRKPKRRDPFRTRVEDLPQAGKLEEAVHEWDGPSYCWLEKGKNDWGDLASAHIAVLAVDRYGGTVTRAKCDARVRSPYIEIWTTPRMQPLCRRCFPPEEE